MTSGTGLYRSTVARRLGTVALVALPVIDATVILLGSSPLARPVQFNELLLTLAALLSAACLWTGLFLSARVSMRLTRSLASNAIRRLVVACLIVAATCLVLYHLLLWSFVAFNGHPPTSEVMVFLADNSVRVIQHALQTSPLLAATAIGASTLIALITLTRIADVDNGRPMRSLSRQASHAAVLLVAWSIGAAAHPGRGPADVFLWLNTDEIDQARLNLHLQSLPPRNQFGDRAQDPSRRVPVIVILVESLRHDLLYTNPEAVPFIKSMYDSGFGFSHAYATASHSNFSDLAFWYSQYPLRGHGKEGFPADAPWRGVSLFDVFKGQGYHTAYVSSQNENWGGMINWLQTPAVDYFFHSESFDGETWENFDDLHGLGGLIKRGLAQAGKVEDSQTLEAAKRWIDSLDDGQPFFLGMNLQNTHFSYVVSPGAAQPYSPYDLGFRAVYYHWPEEQRINVRNRYLNSVLNVDQMLGEFADYLRQKGLWDRAVIVVIGDNGEAFYEHGFGNHSGPMYDEVVRTLALIKPTEGSSLPEGAALTPVSHIDIAATIPNLVGIPHPWSFQGRAVGSNFCAERGIFMYSNAIVRQYGKVAWPYKYLITDHPDQREELYDLSVDPNEQKNLVNEKPAEARRLRVSVSHWISLQRKYYSERAYVDRAPPDFCQAS